MANQRILAEVDRLSPQIERLNETEARQTLLAVAVGMTDCYVSKALAVKLTGGSRSHFDRLTKRGDIKAQYGQDSVRKTYRASDCILRASLT